MNPKDMTKKELVRAHYQVGRCAGIHDGTCRSMESIALQSEERCNIEAELLSRLVERDQYKSQWENCNSDYRFAVEQANALRKENEELRKDNSILNDRLKRANPTTLDSFYGEFS